MGPLCFLLFVNDIGNDITSNIKLFADDTLLYGLVHNSDDAISLQSDLDKLVEWAKLWQMAFNPSITAVVLGLVPLRLNPVRWGLLRNP